MRNTKYKNIIIIIIHVPERPHNCIIIQHCWVLQKNLLRVQRDTECYPNHTSDSDILVLTEIHKSATTKNAIESTQNTVLYMSLCLRMMPTPSSATDGNIRYLQNPCQPFVKKTHHTHAQFVLLLESMQVLHLTDSRFYWIDQSRLWPATISLGSTKAALTDFPLRTAENRCVSLERCATAVQVLPCETHPSDHSHNEDSLWKERKNTISSLLFESKLSG